MNLSRQEYGYLGSLLRDTVGVVLEDGKDYLVQARLAPIAKREGCVSVGELVGRLRRAPGPLRDRVVEAMLTCETQFFRDVHPFECLRRDVLPLLAAGGAGGRSLDIWCAAASTGQEPYSVAMLLADHFPHLAGRRCRLLASDFSPQALRRAEAGAYSPLEVERGLTPELLRRHFRRDGEVWRLDEAVRRRVEFRVINLLDAWTALPRMDLIMLRNVMIYFSEESKERLMERVCDALHPGGFLFLGASETMVRLPARLEQCRFGKTTCYRRPRGRVAALTRTLRSRTGRPEGEENA